MQAKSVSGERHPVNTEARLRTQSAAASPAAASADLPTDGRAHALSRANVREGQLVTAALAALLIWLPLQTPLAVLAYQYVGVSAEGARALLLAKDVAVAVLVVTLLYRRRRELRFEWFDLAAIGYGVLLGVYTVVPWLLGSQVTVLAAVASGREFLVPVELYALGRLAVLSGADSGRLVRWFLWAAAVAAIFTVFLYLFVPPAFWQTTFNLVAFIRDVQGLPVNTLWDISLLGHYGVGLEGSFPRAVGPFTHPVGTAQYFVVPLLLVIALAFAAARRREWRVAATVGLAVALFGAAVITPISRGSWIAAGLGILACGIYFRQVRLALASLAVAGLFVLLVPPFSLSVASALSLQDSSVQGHQQLVESGINTAIDNPIGIGVGQADHLGAAYGDRDTSVAHLVGENMYIAILVTVGPLGLLAFLAWMLGLGFTLFHGGTAGPHGWIRIGIAAALAGFAVSAMTASPLMRFTTGGTFWLLIGLVVGRELLEHPARHVAMSRWGSGLRGLLRKRAPDSG